MKLATWSRRVSAGTLIAAGTAGSVLLLSAVAPAGASTSPTSGEVAVPQGITAASLHGARIAAAPAATKETISFVLKLQNEGALETNVERGMPHGFLSVRTFADRYGQTHANIVALERYLKRFGVKSTAYADGLDVSTTGTAGEYGQALSVRTSLYRLPAVAAQGTQAARPAIVVHGTTDKPLLPARLAKFVYAILGLTSYPVASSDAVHTLCRTRPPRTPSSSATGRRRTSPASTASPRSIRRASGARARRSASSPTPASGRLTPPTSGRAS